MNFILYFFLYSFIGWTIEVIAIFVTKKQLVNRGFLIGPICPIYGVSALLLLTCLKHFLHYPLLLFLAALVLCSILEYLTSYTMEKMFQARWWDYSKRAFNLNGRVCLSNALAFGVLGLILLYYVHPFVLKVLNLIPVHILYGITILSSILFFIDFIFSFQIIFKLKNSMKFIRMDNTREITEKVKETLRNTSFLGKRLVRAFPNLRIIIKDLGQNIERKINRINNRGVR